jgi:hypothetical protein
VWGKERGLGVVVSRCSKVRGAAGFATADVGWWHMMTGGVSSVRRRGFDQGVLGRWWADDQS